MNIGIMCSSSNELNLGTIYNNVNIATSLASRVYNLVMGASENGLMGNVKDVFKEEGHLITAVGLKSKNELDESQADIKIEVDTPGERTAKLYEMSDAIIFLSGGIGTVSEFYTMLTTKIELNDQKPLIIYNGDDECNYDYILKDLEAKSKAGSVSKHYKVYFDVARNEEELLNLLDKYEQKYEKGKSL